MGPYLLRSRVTPYQPYHFLSEVNVPHCASLCLTNALRCITTMLLNQTSSLYHRSLPTSGLFLNFACTIAVSRKRKTSHPYRLWENFPTPPHKRTSKALTQKIQLLTFLKPQTTHSKQVLPTPTQPCRTIIAVAFKHTHAVRGINAQQSNLVLVWAFFWNLVPVIF